MLKHIDMVKCAAKVRRFSRGNTIIRAGDNTAQELFILLKGSAVAYDNAHQIFAAYKAGDFFGEMTLFAGQIPPYNVIAAEDIIALPVSREQVGIFFAEQPEATFALFRELCQRIQLGPQTTAAPAQAVAAPKAQTASPPKAQAVPPSAESLSSPLFPPEHTHHQLEIVGPNSEFLFMKKYKCPICGNEFQFPAVKASKLVAERSDPDLRSHFTGIEPLHFDVVTCPNCWYSAMTDIFKDGKVPKTQVDQLLQEYRGKFPLQLDKSRDSHTVFASYYLALICAVKCFRNNDSIIGKLWLKLSRLYDDCQDEKMSYYATEQALKGYMAAYEKSNTPPKQNQQLCYIIGELSMRTGDYNTARKFFFAAKTDRDGSPVMVRHAEDRIEYLRELSAAAEALEKGAE